MSVTILNTNQIVDMALAQSCPATVPSAPKSTPPNPMIAKLTALVETVKTNKKYAAAGLFLPAGYLFSRFMAPPAEPLKKKYTSPFANITASTNTTIGEINKAAPIVLPVQLKNIEQIALTVADSACDVEESNTGVSASALDRLTISPYTEQAAAVNKTITIDMDPWILTSGSLVTLIGTKDLPNNLSFSMQDQLESFSIRALKFVSDDVSSAQNALVKAGGNFQSDNGFADSLLSMKMTHALGLSVLLSVGLGLAYALYHCCSSDSLENNRPSGSGIGNSNTGRAFSSPNTGLVIPKASMPALVSQGIITEAIKAKLLSKEEIKKTDVKDFPVDVDSLHYHVYVGNYMKLAERKCLYERLLACGDNIDPFIKAAQKALKKDLGDHHAALIKAELKLKIRDAHDSKNQDANILNQNKSLSDSSTSTTGFVSSPSSIPSSNALLSNAEGSVSTSSAVSPGRSQFNALQELLEMNDNEPISIADGLSSPSSSPISSSVTSTPAGLPLSTTTFSASISSPGPSGILARK